MSEQSIINRRDFLKIAAATGAGLVIGFRLPTRDEALAGTVMQDAEFAPNAYLQIDTQGLVTVRVHRSEMGQGVQTAIPMIVAEELEADWTTIRVEQAPADPIYGNQVTGGSVSIQGSYATLRAAGAAARTLLIAAAAQHWGVEAGDCRAENGAVLHDASGRRLTYAELVSTAATMPQPARSDVKLKAPEAFRLIGTRQGQIDNPSFVTGAATFASDVCLPGMLHAVVARCPVFGGKVAGFDASRAEALPGVRLVMEVSTGVAVVADSTWAALTAREALRIDWDTGANADLSSEAIRQMALERIAELAASNSESMMDAASVVEAFYEAPYLAHATMEPMVCVADVRADGCDVWAPTQDRQAALRRVQSITRLPASAINLHVPLIGGAFGRRLRVDYVDEAVEISKAIGAPVQVFWSREDDLQHDFYRPASYHQLRAGLDAGGMPLSWEHFLCAQPIGSPSDLSQGTRLPYQISKKTVRPAPLTLPVPTGYWRSVFNTQNAYVNECFIDELAAASGSDPYEYRMALLEDSQPIKRVLELAATQAGWGSPLPDGWGRGIACHSTWDATPVAQVAEVSVEAGQVQVHRVVCAVDCGQPVNPDMIEAQMEGGIVFGLTSALYGEITLKDGRVEQDSLRNYPLLSFDEMPTVEVYIVPSDAPPKGIGEMGNPPTTPALLNAIFAATGKRIRRLPIRAEDLAGE